MWPTATVRSLDSRVLSESKSAYGSAFLFCFLETTYAYSTLDLPYRYSTPNRNRHHLPSPRTLQRHLLNRRPRELQIPTAPRNSSPNRRPRQPSSIPTQQVSGSHSFWLPADHIRRGNLYLCDRSNFDVTSTNPLSPWTTKNRKERWEGARNCVWGPVSSDLNAMFNVLMVITVSTMMHPQKENNDKIMAQGDRSGPSSHTKPQVTTTSGVERERIGKLKPQVRGDVTEVGIN